MPDAYPVQLNVEYPERPLNRAGEYSSAELGDLFGVARSTAYRAIQRNERRGQTPNSKRSEARPALR